MIHPTAVVDKHAELDSSVEVGPYAVIGPKVKIGPRTRVGPHAVIEGDTTLGANNVVFQFAAIGAIPQDLKYAGEPTKLVIGDPRVRHRAHRDRGRRRCHPHREPLPADGQQPRRPRRAAG